MALCAALPFVAAGPVTAGELLRVLGASVEPLLYVLLLWALRRRPLWFGAVFCIAWLHREFAVFALPPLAALLWFDTRRIAWASLARAGASAGAVWGTLDLLKRFAPIGPPGGADAATAHASLAQEVVQVEKVLSFTLGTWMGRLHVLLTQGLPDQWGLRPIALVDAGVWSTHQAGSIVAGAALLVALTVALGCLGFAWRRLDWRALALPLFLAVVGLETIAAYGLHGGVAVESRTEPSYVLLALLLPIAVLGAFLLVETRRALRWVVVSLVVLWAAGMTVDNARLAREFVVSPPPSEHRELTDYLVSHHVKYARAIYWDSYRVTFLSRERVIVASTDSVRIETYQSKVSQAGLNAVDVVRQPCGEGARVSAWCVIDPLHR